jgi:phage replication O-like protein O
MASPQTEDGYTKIANEIMDALCRIRIPGEEMQVLNAILRKTYGWQKCEDAIALSQFVEMTGMNKPHIIQSIKGLLLKKVIIVTEKGNSSAKVYKFNKDYDKWIPLPKKVMLPKTVISVTENSNASLPKTVPTKETNTKEKKERNFVALPEWLPSETWQEYLEMRKRIKKPLLERSFPRVWKELEKLKKAGNAPEAVLNQSIIGSWQGVFELRRNGRASSEDIFRGAL